MVEFVTVLDGPPEALKAARRMGSCSSMAATRDGSTLIMRLPKTRSGKIMRRLLRDIAEGRAPGDVTTLRDPDVVARLGEAIAVLGADDE